MNNSENSTHSIGQHGEDVACNYLRSLGYTIVCRNYRCEHGETDIIALDGRIYAFVEVKMRTESAMQNLYGRPLRAVNAAKKRRLLGSAKQYIFENKLYGQPARIDILEIYRQTQNGLEKFRINYIKNAVRDEAPHRN